MPELPEVETIVCKLRAVLPGKQIAGLELHHTKPLQGAAESLPQQYVVAVSRRAKIIQFELGATPTAPPTAIILIHLKMTGQLIYQDDQQRIGGGHPTPDWVDQLPSKHTRITMTFADGARLFFNDQRLFGWWKIIAATDLPQAHAGLGPDVTDDTFTLPYFQLELAKKRLPIKVAIMDNRIVCGVGNIYACEALNVARISPFRPALSLTEAEVTALHQAMQQVIALGIELGGTTFDGKYVDIAGLAGQYQTVVRVYGREGQPCPNCGGLIKKEKLAGRGTYFCSECQI